MVRAHNYNENMTISTIYSELLKLLKVNLLWWYIIISKSNLQKDWTAVFHLKFAGQFKTLLMFVSPPFSVPLSLLQNKLCWCAMQMSGDQKKIDWRQGWKTGPDQVTDFPRIERQGLRVGSRCGLIRLLHTCTHLCLLLLSDLGTLISQVTKMGWKPLL